jgi:hypothetical protein
MRLLPDERLYFDTQYCLDFAKTIAPVLPAPAPSVIFHFWWRGSVNRKIVLALNSFRATQNPVNTVLWLWIDVATPDFRNVIRAYSDLFGAAVVVRPYDAHAEAMDTPLEGKTDLLGASNPAAASDAMRLLVLYRYGGLYIDADTMALRDFTPLLLSEYGRGAFCYRWSARRDYGNNAIARGEKGSALGLFLLERARRIGSCHPRLLLAHDGDVPDTMLELPCALFDPLWPHFDGDDRFAERPFGDFRDFSRPFGLLHRRRKAIAGMADFFPGAFAYHWHGLWKMPERRDSYLGLFEAEIEARLASPPAK